MMNYVWTAVIVVLIVWGIVSMFRNKGNWGHHQQQGQPGQQQVPTEREAELQKEVEELRERIQVLERIATEGGDTARLAAEIEKLRDK